MHCSPTLPAGTVQSEKDVTSNAGWCHIKIKNRGGLAARVTRPRPLLASCLDFLCSCRILFDLIWVPETFLVLISSLISAPLFIEYFHALSANMTWTAVSLMVVFPLQSAIRDAYSRREVALANIVTFRSLLVNVYLGNVRWNHPGVISSAEHYLHGDPALLTGNGSRQSSELSPEQKHRYDIKQLCCRIIDAMHDLLLVPRNGNPRETCSLGCAEKHQIMEAERCGRRQVVKLLARLHSATEALKAGGMLANEASRINQYNSLLMRAFERLWAAKVYRTPMTLRSSLRVLIQIMPFLYGPYWVYLSRKPNGEIWFPGVIFSCIFSSMISVIMIALVNLQEHLENPFRYWCTDTLRVKDEIELMRDAINDVYDDMAVEWNSQVVFEWETHDSESGVPI